MDTDASISDEELFYSWLDLLMNDVRCLALPPEEGCKAHGSYNTAFELWYFIPIHAGHVASNSIGLLADLQIQALKNLASVVQHIPLSAHQGTNIAAESIANMHHPGWSAAREQAQRVLRLLESVNGHRDAYWRNRDS